MNPIQIKSIRSGSLRGILHAIALALPVAILAALTASAAGDTTIYSDTLLGSGSALHGTTVDSSAAFAGGTAGATWIAAGSYNETATGTIGTSTTTQGAYLPFTPQAGHMYTLTATLEYPPSGNWAALGFQTQADLSKSQFHDAAGSAYAWVLVRGSGGGQPQFFSGPDTANGGAFATASQSGLQTVTITLDTRAASWTTSATIGGYTSSKTYSSNPTGIAYVGFGGVGTISKTTNFSLTTNANISTRTLTYSAGANGSISGTTPQTVDYGADGTAVTAVADSGYHFVNWSDRVLTASRKDLAVTTDITVTANFNSNTHTLTYSAGANGSITGITPQTDADGTDGSAVTAVADSGYHFVGWSDGVLTASRTDLAVTTDITVTANFDSNSRTLTYIAGANGSISGTTPQTVAYGADGTAVTAVANSGYHFVYWSDGVMTASRTDLAVTTDRTVTASFAINIPANELIYSDTLLGSGSALHGTTVDFSATHAGGIAGATWIAAGSYNETATGTIGTSTTTQGAYLPFTPRAGHVYTLTATLEYLGAVSSNWAALGFQTQADVAHGAFHEASGAAYAWTLLRKAGGGQPQFFGGADTANGGGFATGSESGLKTVTITLDTTGASWTSHATINGLDSATVTYGTNPTDIAYVGFGGVGTTSNTTHFSLSATGGSTPTYATWATDNGVNGGVNGDSNNDGVQNGIAYFMNAIGLATNPGITGNTVTWPNGGNISATEYGTQFVVETSPDLVNWTPVAIGDLTTNTSGPGGALTYTLPPGAVGGKLFARLLVTPN
ncbi:MAG: InlB B-repeat-containing protein [Verrucomicrobiota bacterium]